MSDKEKDFYIKKPCGDCPYRKDAPLRKWDVQEFATLLGSSCSQMGALYGCHKDNGHTCVGWLMDQDKNRFPSIRLRLKLSKHGVNREYLDALKSPSEMYDSVMEMCVANYPEVFKKV